MALAGELGQPLDQARAHDGLAQAHHALQEDRPARDHWQQTLDILTRIGVDQSYDDGTNVDVIRNHLAGLHPQPAMRNTGRLPS